MTILRDFYLLQIKVERPYFYKYTYFKVAILTSLAPECACKLCNMLSSYWLISCEKNEMSSTFFFLQPCLLDL